MELKYRGQTYSSSSGVVETKTTGKNLKYRGQDYPVQIPTNVTLVSSEPQLKYRGRTYERIYSWPLICFLKKSLAKKFSCI